MISSASSAGRPGRRAGCGGAPEVPRTPNHLVGHAHSPRRTRAPTRPGPGRRDPLPPRGCGVHRGGAPRARRASPERSCTGNRRPSRGRAPRRSRHRPQPLASPHPCRSRQLAWALAGGPQRDRARRLRRDGSIGLARANARAARPRRARPLCRPLAAPPPEADRLRAARAWGRAGPARRGSGPPVRGGSRRARPTQPVRYRAAPAMWRSARAARRGLPSEALRRLRRGSASGGSGIRRRPRLPAGPTGSAPGARAQRVVA